MVWRRWLVGLVVAGRWVLTCMILDFMKSVGATAFPHIGGVAVEGVVFGFGDFCFLVTKIMTLKS